MRSSDVLPSPADLYTYLDFVQVELKNTWSVFVAGFLELQVIWVDLEANIPHFFLSIPFYNKYIWVEPAVPRSYMEMLNSGISVYYYKMIAHMHNKICMVQNYVRLKFIAVLSWWMFLWDWPGC